MDGYQLSEKFRQTRARPLGAAGRSSPMPRSFVAPTFVAAGEIEPGNARLRQLMAETVDRDLWRLLWLPPSMPYHEPAGPYAEIDPASVTKHLIFSSWAAAPTAIASLLSWTATHRMQAPPRGDGPDPAPARLPHGGGTPGGHDRARPVPANPRSGATHRSAGLRSPDARRGPPRRERPRLRRGAGCSACRCRPAGKLLAQPRHLVLGRAIRHRRHRRALRTRRCHLREGDSLGGPWPRRPTSTQPTRRPETRSDSAHNRLTSTAGSPWWGSPDPPTSRGVRCAA